MSKKAACCMIGLRPAGFPYPIDGRDRRFMALRQILLDQIGRRIQDGCTHFYSGACPGADMLCAEIVLGLRASHPGLRLTCVIPHEGQAARWNEVSRNRYFALLEQSDHSVLISRRATPDCFQERDRYLVDHAGHVLAVYNSGASSVYGLSYARKKDRHLVLVHPDTLTTEDIPGLRDSIRIIRGRY